MTVSATTIATYTGIPRPDITLEDGIVLGSGRFGDIVKGVVNHTPVAVKRLTNLKNTSAMVRHLEKVIQLKHKNLVTIINLCYWPPNETVLVIMEFMSVGSLKEYLPTSEGRAAPMHHLMLILKQVNSVV